MESWQGRTDDAKRQQKAQAGRLAAAKKSAGKARGGPMTRSRNGRNRKHRREPATEADERTKDRTGTGKDERQTDPSRAPQVKRSQDNSQSDREEEETTGAKEERKSQGKDHGSGPAGGLEQLEENKRTARRTRGAVVRAKEQEPTSNNSWLVSGRPGPTGWSARPRSGGQGMTPRQTEEATQTGRRITHRGCARRQTTGERRKGTRSGRGEQSTGRPARARKTPKNPPETEDREGAKKWRLGNEEEEAQRQRHECTSRRKARKWAPTDGQERAAEPGAKRPARGYGYCHNLHEITHSRAKDGSTDSAPQENSTATILGSIL